MYMFLYTNLRWLAITPHPARFDIFTASILSVTDPIWLTCSNINHMIRTWLHNWYNRYSKQKIEICKKISIPWEEEHYRTSHWLPSPPSAQIEYYSLNRDQTRLLKSGYPPKRNFSRSRESNHDLPWGWWPRDHLLQFVLCLQFLQ